MHKDLIQIQIQIQIQIRIQIYLSLVTSIKALVDCLLLMVQ